VLAKVASATLTGVQGEPILVEVHVSRGLPAFTVVGLPDASCREARDRVRAAVLSSGLSWPLKRVTVNLAPSSVRKVGSGLDLPIALAVLAADGQIPAEPLEGGAFIGELGLDGGLRDVGGVLPLICAAGGDWVVVPPGAASEAAALSSKEVRTSTSLLALVDSLLGRRPWARPPAATAPVGEASQPDLSEVKGQPVARLALEVAAAGGHHLLLVGPPGAGKTMLAERLPGLLPPLDPDQALEVARIHSAAGLPHSTAVLMRRPPFRAPHHSASAVSLLGGGGSRMRPGELSCAHHGVLFLDELGEFPSAVLDSLRQPLEERQILVCRARASAMFPAGVLLVAAMNPCPCGAEGGPTTCKCAEAARLRYASRVSGPLLDRFDLRVAVERPEVSDLLASAASGGESSAVVAERVIAARRLARLRGVMCNSSIPARDLERLAPLGPRARNLLEGRLRDGRLSARGLHRVWRVARTVADLACHEGELGESDVLTAVALRSEVFPPAGYES
jgi:magnesium chelatase family protein